MEGWRKEGSKEAKNGRTEMKEASKGRSKELSKEGKLRKEKDGESETTPQNFNVIMEALNEIHDQQRM